MQKQSGLPVWVCGGLADDGFTDLRRRGVWGCVASLLIAPFDHAIAGRNVLCFVLCRINAVRKLVGITLLLS